jgi:hypothetical protein
MTTLAHAERSSLMFEVHLMPVLFWVAGAFQRRASTRK